MPAGVYDRGRLVNGKVGEFVRKEKSFLEIMTDKVSMGEAERRPSLPSRYPGDSRDCSCY